MKIVIVLIIIVALTISFFVVKEKLINYVAKVKAKINSIISFVKKTIKK